MQNDFQEFLETYNFESNNRKPDKYSRYHELIVHTIPEFLENILGEKYLIRGSYGQGRKTPYPWIGIFNKEFTTSAKKGIYVVYLFRSDMQGFYLSLNQGFTFFKENYKNPFKLAMKVAEHFQTNIKLPLFQEKAIDLKSKHVSNDRGFGYEHTNILAKYYDYNLFSEKELLKDLYSIIDLYEELVNKMSMYDYENIINNINHNNSSFLDLDEADHLINETLRKYSGDREVQLITLEAPQNIPNKKEKQNISIKYHNYKKTDYVEKAKEDGKIGLLGEKMVYDYEIQRLMQKGIENPKSKIRWVSKESDNYGYDIQSVDIDELNNEHPIYIEVKTTKLQSTAPFYLSNNELNTMKDKGDYYYIYRVYSIEDNPGFYIVPLYDFNNKFNITPCSYIVNINQ